MNATKNLKRKCRHDVVFFYLTVDNVRNVVTSANAHHQTLLAQDTRIEQHNKRLRASSDKVTAAHNNVLAGTNPEVRARAEIKLAQAERVYEKQVSVGQNLIGTGSGKVGIYLPQRDQ